MTADPPGTPGSTNDSTNDSTGGSATDLPEEALSWDGEGDVSHEPAPVRRRRASPPAGHGAPAEAEPKPEHAPAQASGFALVTYGILAATSLFSAFGWLTTTTSTVVAMGSPLASFMYHLGEVLAVASAPLWFAAVFFFTRRRKPIVRLLWLLLGLVVLLPVPFLLGV